MDISHDALFHVDFRRLCFSIIKIFTNTQNLDYFSINLTRFYKKKSRSMMKATQNSLQPKQGPRPTMILGRISINPKIISIPHQMILVRLYFFLTVENSWNCTKSNSFKKSWNCPSIRWSCYSNAYPNSEKNGGRMKE